MTGNKDPMLFVSNDLYAGVQGNTFQVQSCKNPSRRMGGKKIVPLNSWDKSCFEGGVFGVGAPIKSSKRALVPDEDRGSKTSLIVNWDILKPIMELCNKQCTLKDKSHKSPSKDLRAT